MSKNFGYIVSDDESVYYVTESTRVEKLKAGCYSIEVDPNNAVFLKSLKLNSEHLIDLPNLQLASIIDGVTTFWKESKKYEKFKLPHKRGILIYGVPGVGKTTAITEVCKFVEKNDGIVILCDQFDDVVRMQLDKIREIEPLRPLTIILENLESILFSEDSMNIELLSFMDGLHDLNHILFIATTNDLEKIPENIKKRPSRFDLKIEIKLPDAADREHYFKEMIPANELKKIDLQAWIKSSSGYTISHLKELITSHFIYNYEFKESISNINKLISNKNTEIGFK